MNSSSYLSLDVRDSKDQATTAEKKDIEQSHLFKDGSRIGWLHHIVPETAMDSYCFAIALLEKKAWDGGHIKLVADPKISRETLRLKKYQLAIDYLNQAIKLIDQTTQEELYVFGEQLIIMYGKDKISPDLTTNHLILHINQNILKIEKLKKEVMVQINSPKMYKPVSPTRELNVEQEQDIQQTPECLTQ